MGLITGMQDKYTDGLNIHGLNSPSSHFFLSFSWGGGGGGGSPHLNMFLLKLYGAPFYYRLSLLQK